MPLDDADFDSGVLRVLQTKNETRAFYNKIARVYDLLAEHTERPMRENGLAKLNAQPGERVLEIGFGTGHCLVELARAVGPQGKVFGIDIAEEMRSRSTTLLRKEGLADRVELVNGDATQLPYADDSLDGVFTSFTLELFDTPEIPAVLAECLRVLQPGGRLAVVSLSKVGKQGVVIKIYEWTHRHFPNLMDCRPIYVRRAIEAAGFEVLETAVEHMWVPVEIVLARNRPRSGLISRRRP
ncbi:MAG: class I SAM-dependent methyltransferase [Planctomycetaceae bacterium]